MNVNGIPSQRCPLRHFGLVRSGIRASRVRHDEVSSCRQAASLEAAREAFLDARLRRAYRAGRCQLRTPGYGDLWRYSRCRCSDALNPVLVIIALLRIDQSRHTRVLPRTWDVSLQLAFVPAGIVGYNLIPFTAVNGETVRENRDKAHKKHEIMVEEKEKLKEWAATEPRYSGAYEPKSKK